MAKDTVEVLIEGGTATPGPPLGPALGPFGINMMQVVEEINKKSADFAGMKVPVKVTIDRDTKDFEIEIGTPPTTALNNCTYHGRIRHRKSFSRTRFRHCK